MKAQGGAIAPGSFEKSRGGLLCWACNSESKKRNKDQGKRKSQKAKNCRRGREKEMNRVPSVLQTQNLRVG